MMKTHVQTTTPDATLAEAVDLMDLYQTPFLPVINEHEQCVGVLSELEVVKFVANYGAKRAKDTLVSEVMASMVVMIYAHQDVTDLLETMLQGKWERMPVVDDELRVIGMLNRVDVLQALFEGSIVDEPADAA